MKLLMRGTAGRGTKELLLEAKRRGIYTIVTDNHLSAEKASLKHLADEYWVIGTAEIDILKENAEKNGRVSTMNDIKIFNISICMKLCEWLNLPCYCTPEGMVLYD